MKIKWFTVNYFHIHVIREDVSSFSTIIEFLVALMRQ